MHLGMGAGGWWRSTINMDPRIAMDDSQKNGHTLQVVDGGQFARKVMRVRTAKEIELDARMKARFGRCVGRNGTRPSRAVQEICEGRQFPWRKNAIRAIEMLEDGVPVPEVKAAIVGEMEQWIDEIAGTPKRAA